MFLGREKILAGPDRPLRRWRRRRRRRRRRSWTTTDWKQVVMLNCAFLNTGGLNKWITRDLFAPWCWFPDNTVTRSICNCRTFSVLSSFYVELQLWKRQFVPLITLRLPRKNWVVTPGSWHFVCGKWHQFIAQSWLKCVIYHFLLWRKVLQTF